MKYIELFAGCGGLSLGLKRSGFKLNFANELSPVAATTYAINLINKSIDNCVLSIENCSSKKIKQNIILHGSIHKLLENIKLQKFNNNLLKDIDLIAGGPPCQGFSMAGLRKETVVKNKLPYAFLEFVEIVKPKAILIENVTGILHAFKNDGGNSQTYKEILKGISRIGYYSICIKLNSEDFGVAEHRPRVIFLGFQGDLIDQKNKSKLNDFIKSNFYPPLSNTNSTPPDYLDLTKNNYDNFIKKPKIKYNNSAKDAIDDLSNDDSSESEYVKYINGLFENVIKKNKIDKFQNHEKRTHNLITSKRFWLKQIISKNQKFDLTVNKYLQGKLDHISKDALLELEGFLNSYDFKIDENSILETLNKLKSKKHSQKVLNPNKPSHTILTIPDDVVHYSVKENRVLTVREEARIQSFPDNFLFHGKPTTGGYQREMETPQYTQVGNAVPPLLGYHIGKYIKTVIKN
jgi:DNA (cytosine-5)-methyltransferase 1